LNIDIIIADLSSNSIVRTYPIAKVLERKHNVKIYGTVLKGYINIAYRDEFNFNVFPFNKFKIKNLMKIKKFFNGDIIYPFKPLPTSLGYALTKKLDVPIILDIEDWEFGVYLSRSKKAFLRSIIVPDNIEHNFYSTYFCEFLVNFVNDITVASNFLQKRFGGVKLPHGADVEFFNPKNFNKKILRKKYNIRENDIIILFAGTAYYHKGIDIIIDVINNIGIKNLKLLFVGTDPSNFLENITDKRNLLKIKYQPHYLMPELLALSDIVIVPNRPTPFSKAQVPGKIYEALAMGKVVIGSDISDIPEILKDCGIIIDHRNMRIELENALVKLIEHPYLFEEFGVKARQIACEKYSWDAMEAILDKLLNKYQ